MRSLACAAALLSLAGAQHESAADALSNTIHGKSIHEFRGFYKREHSLMRPYQDLAAWDMMGSVMITPNKVTITPNEQSKQGSIWNRSPMQSRDWEVQVSFKVSGSTGDLFGDGLAIWYVRDINQPGPVFGSKDNFVGLAVFLDTYSNHNGPHKHGHPYVSAMLNDGTKHYDHDRDGTHTQLGGETTGCEAKFRNKDYDTNILIRYVGDTLSIFTDVDNKNEWKKCMSVDNVHLPTGLHFGVSAATGELSDAHEVVSIKTFEQDYSRVEKLNEINPNLIVPSADFQASPRDHSDDPKPSKLGFVGTVVLVLVGVALVVGAVAYAFMTIQKKNDNSRKRFY